MKTPNRIIHILDDLAMGGVTRALKNFEHPDLAKIAAHGVVDIRDGVIRATTPQDVAVIHFTANWKKLGWLLDLRLRGGFSRIILIEHSYTQGYEVSEVRPKRRFRQMLRFAYGLVDTVVAVSEAQRAWILQHRLARPAKVVAIPQSRCCSELLELKPRLRDRGPLKIGAFGRFHKQKGFDLLIEAMAHIPPEVAEVKLAGSGPDEAQLRNLAAGLPNVEIMEAFSSPSAFLNKVDIVAIPSRWEAFGLVGTEARASGRPIVAAEVDGLSDQLDENGFAHAPGDVQSIVSAIRRAANAKDLNQRGRNAQKGVAKEFNEMIERWSVFLRQRGL
ncbi:MAG: glycosyltransferase family 4 protein [Hyphomonadaceae bacterium]|nr:glycosyltransferase family 4 protein [Hyphomonadaceae bacterium]